MTKEKFVDEIIVRHITKAKEEAKIKERKKEKYDK